MKKLIYILISATVFIACESQEKTELSEMKNERDSLNVVQKDIAQKIRVLDEEIAKMDTTKKLNTVTIMELNPKTFKHYFKVYGVVESNQSIQLYAEASGKIEEIKVKHGERVVKGQLLAVIDGELIEKNIEEMKTALELANKIYEKQSKLWLEENIGSEVQYLQAKHDKESLENKLSTLRHQLSMTKVRAPFSGIVDHVFPKTGEMASPQMAMFRLVNLGNVYLTASVSESYVGDIYVGTPAKVTFKSLGTELDTEVIRVGQFINPDNRTFNVNISLNSNDNFKPNMMASVLLEDYSADNAIVVPSSVILENTEGKSYLYVYDEKDSKVSEVKKVIVETGLTYNGETQILSGLIGDEWIVDQGSRIVKDKEQVRLVNKEM